MKKAYILLSFLGLISRGDASNLFQSFHGIDLMSPPEIEAFTLPADSIGTSSVRLNGICNTNGLKIAAQFFWGSDPYTFDGGTTPIQYLEGDSEVVFFVVLTDLIPGTTYYYNILLWNVETPSVLKTTVLKHLQH